MAKIVQISDFKGKYQVSQNAFDVTSFQSFIDKYERKYLYDLLGVTLGDLLLADITTPFAVPTTLIYQTIFNELNLDNTSFCRQIRSNGIKEMLLGFIYFEYIRSKAVVNTPVGSVIAQNEVSIIADWNSTGLYANYNEAIKSYQSIQRYILLNSVSYTDFYGSNKSYNHQLI
jgi:hypothetical protein